MKNELSPNNNPKNDKDYYCVDAIFIAPKIYGFKDINGKLLIA